MSIFKFEFNSLINVRYMGNVVYVEPWEHFKRTIDEYILYVVKSGELYIREGEKEYVLKTGQYLILEPNIEHEGFKKASCNYYFIHFNSNHITKVENTNHDRIHKEMLINRSNSLTSDLFSYNTNYLPCYLPKTDQIENYFEIFQLLDSAIMKFYQKLDNYKLFTSLEFTQIIITLSNLYSNHILGKNENISVFKLRKLVNYLENNYQSKIVSKDIELYLDTNYDYINRLFKKYFNTTIVTYLNNIRIEKAKELIVSTDKNFNEIADLVGLNDQYYFSKLFKKVTGLTPNKYRQNMAAEIRSENIRLI